MKNKLKILPLAGIVFAVISIISSLAIIRTYKPSVETVEFKIPSFELEQQTGPSINIYYPLQDATANGDQRICVVVEDNKGVSKIEFFVDGNKIGDSKCPDTPLYVEFPVSDPFWWNTLSVKNGKHRIGVKATNKDNESNISTVDVYVDNPALPQKKPKLVVTKHELFRHKNTFAVELTIENKGNEKAYGIKIDSTLNAFQPISEIFNNADYKADFKWPHNFIHITEKCYYIAPGESRTYRYRAIPILMYPNPPNPSIGDCIELVYYGPKSNYEYKEKVKFPAQNTIANESILTAHNNAVKECNYLITTRPEKIVNTIFYKRDKVLSDIADFAFSNYGVLGYLNTDTNWTGALLWSMITKWSKMLHPAFSNPLGGYLLIVGQNDVIPAWTVDGFDVETTKSTLTTVTLTDMPYADITGDGVPDLNVGRLISYNDNKGVSVLKANKIGFSKALLVSGDGNDDAETVKYNKLIDDTGKILSNNKLTVDFSKQFDKFDQKAQNTNIIFYRGHGLPDEWCKGIKYYINVFNFGNTNPFVFTGTCLSGNYEKGDLAEQFFGNGASIYIGATEISTRDTTTYMWTNFFLYWSIYKSIGETLTSVKRDKTFCDEERYWSYEYNLYGDPKLGAPSNCPPSIKATPEPKSSIDVTIPTYVVTKKDGLNYVEIPGGNLLLKHGWYRIPYCYVSLDYPKGHEVQDVILTDMSGLVTDTGLKIPITIMEIGSSQENIQSSPIQGEGLLPKEKYVWNVIKNLDETITLTLIMYPFQYNPKTTDVKFYKRYSFKIKYNVSNVVINSLTTNKDAYREGDGVVVNVGLSNSGGPQDVNIYASVKRYATGELRDVLPPYTVNGLIRENSSSFRWDSSGFEPGYYYMEVTVKDMGENILDRKTVMYRLGIYSLDIIDFVVTPQSFDIGGSVNISITFKNTGTVNIPGTVVMEVQDETEKIVKEFRRDFDELTPDERIAFDDVWDTCDAKEGTYNIVGYVLYDSKATDLKTVTVKGR